MTQADGGPAASVHTGGGGAAEQAHRELDSRVSLAGSRGAAMAVTCRNCGKVCWSGVQEATAASSGRGSGGRLQG